MKIEEVLRKRGKPRQHGSWIFAPEDDAIYIFGQKADPADLGRIHGIFCAGISFLYAAEKPLGIVGRDIRPSADAENQTTSSFYRKTCSSMRRATL